MPESGASPATFPRLDELTERFDLTADQVERLREFGALLVTDEDAPTTVREPARVRDDHLADALVALELPILRDASALADLGSGPGVPGIPLAIALPDTRVTLVEGNGRKCGFLRAAVGALSLRNVEVIHGRAETATALIEQMDVLTARALAPLEVVAEYAAPLLRIGGALIAWRGEREPEAEHAAARAAAILGLSPCDPIRVEPYRGALHRHLHVLVKTAPTPPRFPRRDGVARKRPLGRK